MAFVDDLTALLGANVLNGDILYIGRPGDADPDRIITAQQLAAAMSPRIVTENDGGAFGISVTMGNLRIIRARINLGDRDQNGAGTYASPWRSNLVDWPFPQAFAATPRVYLTAECGSTDAATRGLAIAVTSISTTQATGIQAVALSSTNGSPTVYAQALAIGAPA